MAAKPRIGIAAKGEPVFYALEDGALSNPRMERYALYLVDEVPHTVAWPLTGGRMTGGSNQYRRKVEAYPPFAARVAALKQEKEDLMADDLYGEAKYMAMQMWREARATGNATMAASALAARMKIMEKEDARRPIEAAPQDGVKPQGRPGKPVTENPQTHTGMEAIRQKLLEAGAPVPGSAPSDGKDASNSAAKINVAVLEARPAVVDMPPPVDFQAQLDRLLPG